MRNKDIIEGIQGIVNVEGHSGSIRFIGLLDGVGMFQQIRFYLYETDFEGEYYNYDKKKFRFYSEWLLYKP